MFAKKRFTALFIFSCFALTSCGLFGGGDEKTPEAEDYSALQSQIVKLENEISSLRAETVSSIRYRSKEGVIMDLDNPAVSRAVEVKEEIMSNLPDSIWIRGTEYSTRLTILTLNSQNLTNADIAELKYMVYLEELHIYENRISDLSTLTGMTNLKVLTVFNNQVADLTPIAGLVNLDSLYLRNNNITDISPLDGLVNLVNLDLSENNIADITPLAGLGQVKLLRLNNNRIQSLAGLGSMRSLSRVHLQNNRISDLSAVQTLTEITEIYLQDNNIRNIEPLRALTTLGWLRLERNPISDLKPLGSLTELRKLYIGGIDYDDSIIEYLNNELPRCEIHR